MSARTWYVREVSKREFPRHRQAKGAGWVRPVVLVCECGMTTTFDVVAAVGPACGRCTKDLFSEENLDAAEAAIHLGGDWKAVLTDMLGLPELDDALRDAGIVNHVADCT